MPQIHRFGLERLGARTVNVDESVAVVASSV
jgi:hypothetical protein